MKNDLDNSYIGFRYPDAPVDMGVSSPPMPSLRMLVSSQKRYTTAERIDLDYQLEILPMKDDQ